MEARQKSTGFWKLGAATSGFGDCSYEAIRCRTIIHRDEIANRPQV